MKVGIALNMLTKEGIPDAPMLAEHLALGETVRVGSQEIATGHVSSEGEPLI